MNRETGKVPMQVFCITIVWLMLFGNGPVNGQQKPVSEKRSFIIGVEDIDYYPMYVFREGRFEGYGGEILDRFAKDNGYSFTYKPLPVLRLYNDLLKQKSVDFKYPDNIFWKQELKKGKHVVYSTPVVNYIDGVVVPPEHLGRVKNRFRRLGIILGFTPWEYLEDINSKKIKLYSVCKYENVIKMALAKRIDGAYGSISVLNYQLAKIDKTGALVFDPGLPHTKSSYLLSTVSYPDVIEQFSQWLHKNREEVKRLQQKYSVGVY